MSILVVGAAASCALAPPMDAPHVTRPHFYAKSGVEFAYPANWDLSERVRPNETNDGEVRSISVGLEGQAGAILRVMSPPPPDLDLRDFVESFSSAVTSRLGKIMELERAAEVPIATEVAGERREGIRKELTFSFFLARLPLSIDFFIIEGEEQAAYLVTVSMEEKEKAERAFELIRRSLKLN